jgi:hypothetical protein
VSSDNGLLIDVVTLICACGVERKFYPYPHLKGAQALMDFMKDPTRVSRCRCGAQKCDIKARMRMLCIKCSKLMPLKGPCELCGWVAPENESTTAG